MQSVTHPGLGPSSDFSPLEGSLLVCSFSGTLSEPRSQHAAGHAWLSQVWGSARLMREISTGWRSSTHPCVLSFYLPLTNVLCSLQHFRGGGTLATLNSREGRQGDRDERLGGKTLNLLTMGFR